MAKTLNRHLSKEDIQMTNKHMKRCSTSLVQFSPVQSSRSVVSDSLRTHESQHARPPCPSPTPGAYSNPCPLSQWCHPTISSSVFPFSSCPNPSQHQGLFQWVNSLHEIAKVLELLVREMQIKTTEISPYIRMIIRTKSINNRCWRGCGEKGTLLYYWWEYKLIQWLWKIAWRFLKKLGEPQYNNSI